MNNEEKRKLITQLQSQGLRLINRNRAAPTARAREASTVRSRGASGRTGGAGPSDHKAITVDGTTVMIPVYNDIAADSPYSVVSSTPEVANIASRMASASKRLIGK